IVNLAPEASDLVWQLFKNLVLHHGAEFRLAGFQANWIGDYFYGLRGNASLKDRVGAGLLAAGVDDDTFRHPCCETALFDLHGVSTWNQVGDRISTRRGGDRVACDICGVIRYCHRGLRNYGASGVCNGALNA